MSSDTRIRVSEENWKQLNRAREPGETMNDALKKFLSDDGDGSADE